MPSHDVLFLQLAGAAQAAAEGGTGARMCTPDASNVHSRCIGMFVTSAAANRRHVLLQ